MTFELSVNTIGYVGFGISPKGGMRGADIFVAGVHANGTVYSSVINKINFLKYSSMECKKIIAYMNYMA